MPNIRNKFNQLKQQNKKAFIPYLTYGFPDKKTFEKIVLAVNECGVDFIEIGMPFSDPIADGPTIQAASVRALDAGTTPMKVLEIAREIKCQHDVPIVVMTYYNPMFRIGLDNFCHSAKDCMVDGFIVPDLPVEEAADYKKAAKVHGLDTIFLAAPSTTDQRLSKIVECSSGFLYLVSHYGVTGAKTTIEGSTVQLIRRVQPFTAGKIPLAVGFGISKPEHVERIIAAGADAAIVGSAFINIIAKNQGDENLMLKELKATAHSLKAATTK